MHLLYGKDLLNVCIDYIRIDLFFILLIKEIPKLLPMPEPEQPEEPINQEEDENEPPAKATKIQRNLKTSGPKVVDPYTEDQSSSFIPLLIAIAAVIPVIFCLCRL